MYLGCYNPSQNCSGCILFFRIYVKIHDLNICGNPEDGGFQRDGGGTECNGPSAIPERNLLRDWLGEQGSGGRGAGDTEMGNDSRYVNCSSSVVEQSFDSRFLA